MAQILATAFAFSWSFLFLVIVSPPLHLMYHIQFDYKRYFILIYVIDSTTV